MIQFVLDGRDAIGQTQSGTGKTATCVEDCLRKIDCTHGTCQALVLAPRRELAQQIQKVALALDDYLKIQLHVLEESRCATILKKSEKVSN